MARPIEYRAEEVAQDLMNYIDSTKDPYIEEYCLKDTSPSRDTIYRLAKESSILSDTIKHCHIKQQLRTVRGAEAGEINSTFAIFKLKQKCYGWTDKQEIEQTNTNLNIEMSEEERKSRIEQLKSKLQS